MGFEPTIVEKVAYFVVVVVLIAAILSGTYFFLRRRNKKIQSRLSPSIRLTRQDQAPQPTQHPESARDFDKTRAPRLPSTNYRSASRDTGGDFTASWAREQAHAAARGETRPLTIYPESSVSSAPWQFSPRQHEERQPPRGRQLSTRTHRTRSPIRGISPLTRRLRAETRHLSQWSPRSDSLTALPTLTHTRPRPTYASPPPFPSAAALLTPSPPPPPTSPPHQIYTLHLNRPRLAHAPSHYSAASPDRAFHHNQPDVFSNPHRGTPSPSPYRPARRHTSPSPSPSPPSSPNPSSAATDIARCVNPYYLSATLARRAARPPTSRRARWSAFGLGSDPGTDSEVGAREMVVCGRAPVVEVLSPAVPAPLRVGRGRDRERERGRDRAGENGRGQEGVERERERERVREGARREELMMPVGYGGMF